MASDADEYLRFDSKKFRNHDPGNEHRSCSILSWTILPKVCSTLRKRRCSCSKWRPPCQMYKGKMAPTV
jgi:hypothetical protein